MSNDEALENQVQRALEGSLTDRISLTMCAADIPEEHRQEVFSMFLESLRDTDAVFESDAEQRAPSAVLALVFLNGIGRCSSYVKKNNAVSEALMKDWEVVARWTRRLCDNFESVVNPFPGALINYEEWYSSIVLVLALVLRDLECAHRMWSVPDARHAMCRIWLFDAPESVSQYNWLIVDMLKMLAMNEVQHGADFTAELVKESGFGEEKAMHIIMTRMINATRAGDIQTMSDIAFIILYLTSSRYETIRSVALKKKAIPYLTKTFVKIVDPQKFSRNEPLPDFLHDFLLRFENITGMEGGYPYILQALRHGFLQGVVHCGALLDKLHRDAIEALQRIIGNVLTKYLVYYPYLLGVLDAIQVINIKDLEQYIDQTELGPHWALFEETLLARTIVKSLYVQSDQSDLSISKCFHCGKVDSKKNLQKCGGCKNVHYCSRGCQKSHWNNGGHRLVCKNTPERLRGWSRHDQRYRDFLTRLEVRRHIKGLHQLAVTKYGVEPTPNGSSLNYGCSIDYTTVPPTLGVFRLEEVAHLRDPQFTEGNDMLVEQLIEAKDDRKNFIQAHLPAGLSSTIQIKCGKLGMHIEGIFERESEATQYVTGLGMSSRTSGVDGDGVPLQHLFDLVDNVMNELSSGNTRVGVHYRWNADDSYEDRGGGHVTVVEELDAIVKALNF
ncbi:hypothetical protein SCHPADRAFT_995079 [Schizopora paradoxa]|uniref:MYND-type domain-containing protein n=1 Tax=Schizopora paradoxa TaxID=27342 RepID=A0A0H2RXM4_9AGAM|nr:hypothetical protein SCHPADRAFT_995079 [Schizopora paradoxa]